jgi:hypothetical protein
MASEKEQVQQMLNRFAEMKEWDAQTLADVFASACAVVVNDKEVSRHLSLADAITPARFQKGPMPERRSIFICAAYALRKMTPSVVFPFALAWKSGSEEYCVCFEDEDNCTYGFSGEASNKQARPWMYVLTQFLRWVCSKPAVREDAARVAVAPVVITGEDAGEIADSIMAAISAVRVPAAQPARRAGRARAKA